MNKSIFLICIALILGSSILTSCKKDENSCRVESKFDGVWNVIGYPGETITVNGSTVTYSYSPGYSYPAVWTVTECDGDTFSGTLEDLYGDVAQVSGIFADDNNLSITIDGDLYNLVRV